MLEDKKNNEPSKSSAPREPQTVHIFVGGLRRPAKKQNDDPAVGSEKPSEPADG
jgi:hypothetical protein